MKRVVTPELLDEDLGTPEEIRTTLLDLRGINHNFGGFASLTSLVREVAERTSRAEISLLDVAGGTGDAAEQVKSRLAGSVRVSAVVLDRAVSHMRSHELPTMKVAGDALALPFASHSFDVVGCNLFLHHLEPDTMLLFLREALRVARLAVVASDLRRNRFHWMAAHAGKLTYRSRLTRNDAPASVRRAYTVEEIQAIAEKTSAQVQVKQHFFQRFGLILWNDNE